MRNVAKRAVTLALGMLMLAGCDTSNQGGRTVADTVSLLPPEAPRPDTVVTDTTGDTVTLTIN